MNNKFGSIPTCQLDYIIGGEGFAHDLGLLLGIVVATFNLAVSTATDAIVEIGMEGNESVVDSYAINHIY